MTSRSPLRRVWKAGLIAGAFVVGIGADAPSPQRPAPPPIALARAVLNEAAIYQDYVAGASTIGANFKSGDDVAAALKTGESYDPQQLLRGEIAYAAVVALQDPDFVAALRAYAGDDATRVQVRDALYHDPNYVLTIKGSDGAAGLVIAALMNQAHKLTAAGAVVKQAAFDIQHQAWSKAEVVDRPRRLQFAENFSPSTEPSTPDEVARLQLAVNGAQPLMVLAPPAAQPYSPAVVRGLALAALAAIGFADDDNAPYLTGFQNDPASVTCLDEAKHDIYECLAVAKPHYEDIFCLGQHAMSETAQCLAVTAGAPPPVATPIPVATPPVVHHARRRRHGA